MRAAGALIAAALALGCGGEDGGVLVTVANVPAETTELAVSVVADEGDGEQVFTDIEVGAAGELTFAVDADGGERITVAVAALAGTCELAAGEVACGEPPCRTLRVELAAHAPPQCTDAPDAGPPDANDGRGM